MLDAASSLTPLQPVEATRPIRVLVVDDSVVLRRLVTRMLESEPGIQVVGSARDGLDALAKVEQLRPDVVTLDVEMPELDGLGALRLIQQRFPSTRVIMCSSLTERGAAVTMDALLAGASDYVTKQSSESFSDGVYETLRVELTTKIKQMFSRVRLRPSVAVPMTRASSVLPRQAAPRVGLPAPQILAIGVSTGGPSALAELIPMIPKSFPLPVAIVQHMPPLFTQLLAERLTKLGGIPVHEATNGMEIKPGHAVLAPGDFHMRLVRKNGITAVELNQHEYENSCRPAVDVLFRSIAEVYGGAVLAVVLTGMGQDGLLGIRQLKPLGAFVIAQDSASSVVWGMPGAIVGASLADVVLPLKDIVPQIVRRV
jgi:two-component system chemotaxis response regulator CheB